MLLEMSLPKEFVSKAKGYEYKTNAQKLISTIKQQGVAVVLRQGQYFGIVDDRAFARSDIAKLQKISIGKFAVKVPLLSSGTSIKDALRYFYESNARALPFTEGSKISGVVKRERLLETLLSLHMLSKVKAGEIMISPVIGIDSEASVAEAISAMQKNKINRLLVISNNKPTGIITNGDIAFSFAKPAERLPEMKNEAHALDSIRIGSISQPYLYTIDYYKSADEAIRQMVENGFSSLAVTRNGKIVGLITEREIFKAAVATIASEIPIYVSGLEAYAKENEDDIKRALGNAAKKISRFSGLGVEAVFANVRSKKSAYDIRAHVKFERGAELRASASMPMLDDAVKELTDKLYNMAKKQKEKSQTKKEQRERLYA
ncbi:MAG: CBS domain-containing protein [Candidatus Micrarchaeia archaeon]